MKHWLVAGILLASQVAHGQSPTMPAPTVTAHTRQTLLSPGEYPVFRAQQKEQDFTLGTGMLDEGDTSELATLHFTNIDPKSVQHQVVVQAAIGQDGPWGEVDARAVSPWKKVPATGPVDVSVVRVGTVTPENFLVTRILPDENSIKITQVPKAFGTAKAAEPGPGGAKLADCVDASGHFDANAGPCYTYLSEDRFRFRGKDGKSYTLTIPHAGGC